MKKLAHYVDFARPFTLLPPALGVVSGAVTAWGAHGTRIPLTASLLLPVLWGALMAGVLNAASNAINQIYDLDIDRVNKPKRPLPAGTLGLAEARGARGPPRMLLDRALHERPGLGLLGAAAAHEAPRALGQHHDRDPARHAAQGRGLVDREDHLRSRALVHRRDLRALRAGRLHHQGL